MLRGSDAPLVPYYAVAKVWAGVGAQVTGLRLLSAWAAAAAVSCLALLLARWSGWGTAFTAAGLLTGLAGFDRFAQEARPYALLALLVCASWLAWDCWRISRSTRAGAAFALLTAAVVMTHLFGLLMLPAQILADRADPAGLRSDPPTAGVASSDTEPEAGHRPAAREQASTRWPFLPRARSRVLAWLDRGWPGWRGARGTVAWGLLGVLVANVEVGVAVVNGSGPSANIPVTASDLWQNTVISLTALRDAQAAAVWILALAGMGAAMVSRPRWRRAVTPLLWWVLLPVVLSSVATVVQPNLLRARYWIGILPAVAGLAAVGVMVVAGAAVRLVHRSVRAGPRAATIIATAVALAMVAVHLAVEAPHQLAIRAGAGHGEDAAAALSIATAAADRDGDPIVVSPTQGALVMSVVGAGSPLIRPLFTIDPTQADVWPVERPASAVAADLAAVRTLHWLYREPGGTLVAGPVSPVPPTQQVTGNDIPAALAPLHFHIVNAAAVSPGWILATLTRS